MIVRTAVAEDAKAMTAVLNEIIALGGTTAHDDLGFALKDGCVVGRVHRRFDLV